MNTVVEYTVPEKILLAGAQLERDGQSPFSAEALIVAAWQKFPRTFGLRGFSDQYPDSNKVLSSIMGEKGLARRGWLAKVGQKLYAVTREGQSVVRRLAEEDEQNNPPPVEAPAAVKLTRDQERFLQGLFAATAVDKIQGGRKMELTFADACRFWGITENLRASELNGRLKGLRTQLADLGRLLGRGSATLSNGRSVAAPDLHHLAEIHDYLEERFSRHLILLRNRSERS